MQQSIKRNWDYVIYVLLFGLGGVVISLFLTLLIRIVKSYPCLSRGPIDVGLLIMIIFNRTSAAIYLILIAGLLADISVK